MWLAFRQLNIIRRNFTCRSTTHNVRGRYVTLALQSKSCFCTGRCLQSRDGSGARGERHKRGDRIPHGRSAAQSSPLSTARSFATLQCTLNTRACQVGTRGSVSYTHVTMGGLVVLWVNNHLEGLDAMLLRPMFPCRVHATKGTNRKKPRRYAWGLLLSSMHVQRDRRRGQKGG